MIGKTVGPYLVERELGAGGMGCVYLATVEREAHGLAVGDRVALKVVHPHLMKREGLFKRFLREAETGRRVQHDNVVSTLDVDGTEVDGVTVLYLVMEYVAGRTLRVLLEDLGTVPEALLREIARQIADGLTAIHEAGIVHRDLKPENILVTDDHQVRIMDLGVARLVEASTALTKEGQFTGSLQYAAPEQFRGREVGPEADLYALGVLLYELSTGVNPFLRDDPAAIVKAQLEEIPESVDRRGAEVSPFFSEVIGCLLSKDAGDRFESARRLREVLEEGEQAEWWSSREPVTLIAHLPRVPVRRETAVYGRRTELESLRAAWAKARGGGGHTALLEGEAGIGKTRLVDLILQELTGEDAHVLYGSYPPSGGLGGISSALIDHFGPVALADSLRPYLAVTPGLVPAFAALIQHQSPPEGSEPLSEDALHAVFCHLLHGLSAEKPVLWVVDDLHFAGPDSRRIVLSLARAAEGRRVLLLLTTRPGLPDEEQSHLALTEGFTRLRLGRLSPREVVELLRDAFRSEALADKVGARIAYKSDGVPFFVFEMIRGLRDGQFIEETPDGTFVATRVIDRIEVPSSVRDLISGRLADLSEEERAVLDVGAVQGFEFRADLIANVRGMRRLVVLEKLASIERRNGVIRSGAEGYRFDHHQIQEVLYQEVPPALRSEYHAALADALVDEESLADRDPATVDGETAYFLALNHLRGSRPARCRPYLVPALDHLGSSYRNEAAADLADRALRVEGMLAGAERAEVLLRRAHRLNILGRTAEEARALEEALDLADGLGDPVLRARARSRLGAHLSKAGEYEPAKAEYERALEIAVETGDRSLEANTIGSLGNVALSRGREEEAEEHYERALEIAREAKDRRLEGWLAGNLGSARWTRGRYEPARESYELSLMIAREIGDRHIEGTATGNLGRVFDRTGEHAKARELLERRIHMAREIGAPRGEAIALVNLGAVLARLGDLEHAQAALTRAERKLREMDAPSILAFAVVGLGRLARERGETEEAEARYREALDLRREIDDRAGVASALLALGRLREDPELLRQALAEAEAAEAAVTVVLASARLACLPGGDAKAAAAALDRFSERLDVETRMEASWLLHRATGEEARAEEARRLLTTLLSNAPEELRDSMRKNVRLHREILGAVSS